MRMFSLVNSLEGTLVSKWIENLKDICSPLVMLGMGSAISWMLLLIASPVFTVSMPSLSYPIPWRSAVLVSCFCALGGSVFIEKKRPLLLEKLTGGAGPIACSAASIVGLLVHSFIDASAAQCASAALVGLSAAAIALSWARPLSSLHLRRRIAAAASGSIVGCLLFVATTLMPNPFNLFFGIALSPVSLGCLMTLGGPSDKQGEPMPWREGLFDRRLAASTAAFGVLLALCGHMALESESQWASSCVAGRACIEAFLVLEIALSIYLVKKARPESPALAHKPSVACMALALLFFPFVSEKASIICLACAFAGFGCFMVFFAIVLGNMAQKLGTAPLETYARGFLVLTGGILLGEAIAQGASLLPSQVMDYRGALCLIGMFVLLISEWQFLDATKMASETSAMGGADLDENQSQENAFDIGKFAEQYGLSPREQDVLNLLIKGRSVPFICDELFLAKSTVATHVKHLYKKVGITQGRQELLDIVEHFEK